MECPACHTRLFDSALYCQACGRVTPEGLGTAAPNLPDASTASRECLTCAQVNAPVSEYCTRCGSALEQGVMPSGAAIPLPADVPEEGQLVTVLHADICGFTRIAEQLTPEQTRALVDALFSAFNREIVARGGRVDAYIGDAVLAVFGVPFPHPDDAARAVTTAVALHRALARFSHPLVMGLPSPLRVRIGIDTGPVVVGRIGAIRRTTLTGATVADAMELERAAPPGETLIGESTWRRLPDGAALRLRPLATGRVAYLLPESSVLEPEAGHHRSAVAGHGSDVHGSAISADPLEPPFPTGGVTGPASLESHRALIQARIDGLALEERRLIKAAAVAGVYFWQDLLERLGITTPDRSLETLEARGLIQACARSGISGTAEYRFTSELVRDVAYHQNLIRVLAFSHRVVAAWLEERVSGNLEFVPLMAHHHAMGGDVVAAAQVLIQAAQRLTGLHAVDEAIARYREALAWLEQGEPTMPDALRLTARCREAIRVLMPGGGEGA